MWEACQREKSLCYRPDFVGQLCTYFPIQLIKVVRLRVKELTLLLEDISKDWKIVYLARDPRGVMASRANLEWCQLDPVCSDVRRLCADVQEEFKLIERQKIQYPDTYYLLKFEDLAANVEEETAKLFRFLGLSVTVSVKEYLNTHTRSNGTGNDPYATIRESKSKASEWRTKLSSSDIGNFTEVCANALKMLNYTI